jgi:hypothetical protein
MMHIVDGTKTIDVVRNVEHETTSSKGSFYFFFQKEASLRAGLVGRPRARKRVIF